MICLFRSLAASLLIVAVMSVTAIAQDDAGLLPTDGLPIVSWKDAGKAVGRQAVVFGEIVNVGQAKGISFLNFSRTDRKAFTSVVFEDADAAFGKPYDELFLNKKVTIRGTITLFKGTPQIVIGKPEQITVVDAFPEEKWIAPKIIEIGDELTIGSYNIKNLFDTFDDPYHNDEGTKAKPREEMRQVANVIREINADVLAFQEVESRGHLQQFVNAMLSDMGYMHVVHFEGNDGRGIDVCLISRIPVGAVTSHRHHVFKATDGGVQRFGRDLLQVELLPDGGEPFEMWVVHLKSNSGGKELNEPIRLGECREVHRLIAKRLKQDPNASLILCGDFNDTFETKTIQTILGNPPQLKTVFDDVPEAERITYNREPYRSMIDFLFCSPAMKARMVPGSFSIRAGTDDDSGSDHNPIFAKFGKGKAGEAAVEKAASVSHAGTAPTMTATPEAPEALRVSKSKGTKVGVLAGAGLLGLGLLGTLAFAVTRKAKS